MRHYTDSIQFTGNPENEDFSFHSATSKGDLFFILDFANFSYPNFFLKLQPTLKEIIETLDTVPGITIPSFLGHLARDLNNYIFTFGRDNCDGKLFCVAAIALLHGTELYYLTYGDSRINVFTDNKLLLLNGAKYQTRSVINDVKEVPLLVREDPEQMGRSLWGLSLTDKVRSYELGNDDVVLMFSDGLEGNVTPQRRLSELRTIGGSDPATVCKALLKIPEAGDDRTITVICGPYVPLATSITEQVNKDLEEFDLRLQGAERASERQDKVIVDLDSALGQLKSDYAPKSQLSELKRQMNSQLNSSKVEALEERMKKLESRFAKVPVLTTGDEAAVEVPRESANTKATDDRNQAETVDSSQLIINKAAHDGKRGVRGMPGDRKEVALQITVAISIFVFGMIVMWVSQVLYEKMWPEKWTARTEGELLIVRREDSSAAGRGLRITLPPPTLNINREANSFEELIPHLLALEHSKRPDPSRPSSTVNANSDPLTETAREVTVQPGDSLGRLASRYKTTEAKLVELNPRVRWPDIKPGDKIQVPVDNAANQTQQK